jgi:osmotically-inducible protein OsmY
MVAKSDRKAMRWRIEQVLSDEGLNALVEDDGTTLRLEGRLDTPEARQAAEDIARRLAPGWRLENNLEVEAVWPATPADDEVRPADGALEPDFTDQQLATSPTAPDDERDATIDDMPGDENVVFAPTDPVLAMGADGEVDVLGGFAPTAYDDDTNQVPRSTIDGQPGDEAIAEHVRRALRRDGLTTDLRIAVAVANGVVHLRGVVPTLDDVESAEEVAGRVEGVVEVVEELDVAGF